MFKINKKFWLLSPFIFLHILNADFIDTLEFIPIYQGECDGCNCEALCNEMKNNYDDLFPSACYSLVKHPFSPSGHCTCSIEDYKPNCCMRHYDCRLYSGCGTCEAHFCYILEGYDNGQCACFSVPGCCESIDDCESFCGECRGTSCEHDISFYDLYEGRKCTCSDYQYKVEDDVVTCPCRTNEDCSVLDDIEGYFLECTADEAQNGFKICFYRKTPIEDFVISDIISHQDDKHINSILIRWKPCVSTEEKQFYSIIAKNRENIILEMIVDSESKELDKDGYYSERIDFHTYHYKNIEIGIACELKVKPGNLPASTEPYSELNTKELNFE